VSEMACKELVATITAYLDRTLSSGERRRFEDHLAECPLCTEYLGQMRATIERLGRLDETTLSGAARERLLLAFRDWRSHDRAVD
jgi:anti-sigma factor RsiW